MPLVGIYSFPKSGNTWMRQIVAGLTGMTRAQVPDLHRDSIDDAREFAGFRFYKIHSDKPVRRWKGTTLETSHVIHIRRNPLDVFVSYMNFISRNVTSSATFPFDTVDSVAGTPLMDLYLKSFTLFGQVQPSFMTRTGGYFEHNRAWMQFSGLTKELVRYEDMVESPETSLAFLPDWLGLPREKLQTSMARAAKVTKVDGKFFWSQRMKSYFDFLSEDQIEEFLRLRGKDCAALGYDPDWIRTRPDPEGRAA